MVRISLLSHCIVIGWAAWRPLERKANCHNFIYLTMLHCIVIGWTIEKPGCRKAVKKHIVSAIAFWSLDCSIPWCYSIQIVYQESEWSYKLKRTRHESKTKCDILFYFILVNSTFSCNIAKWKESNVQKAGMPNSKKIAKKGIFTRKISSAT